MVNLHFAQLVGFDQCEGRTLDLARMTEAANQAARQRGLARTQVAMQIDDATTAGRLSDACAQREHGSLVCGIQIHFRHGDCSSSN